MSRGPVDPRLLRHARSSRGGIALLALIGAGQAAATLGVAVALCQVVAGPRVEGIALLVAAFAARAGLAWAEQVTARRTAARVTDELRRALLAAAVRRGPAWVASFGSGRLTAILSGGLDALRPWFAGYLPALALGVLLPPVVVVVMAVVDPASAVIAAVTLPLVPLLGALIGWATQARARQRWAADARLAGHFLDVVRGLGTLRVYGRAQRQTEVIAELTDRHRRATLRVLRVAFLSSTALDLVGTLSVGLIAVQAGLRVAAGDLNLAPALLVILLAPEAYRPLREMAARYHAATDATAVIADVDEILTGAARDDAVSDGALASTGTAGPVRGGLLASTGAAGPVVGGLPASTSAAGPVVGGATEPAEAAGSVPGGAARLTRASNGRWGVRVSGLRARYPGARADAALLDELTVAAGEIVALRGPSGAGKTTALRVLAGLHPAEAGAIAVGRAFHLSQRPTLPHARTVVEAFPPGTTGAEIEHALRAVGLHGEISPSTSLGEHSAGISAGQRQRLALAAVLHRAAQAVAEQAGAEQAGAEQAGAEQAGAEQAGIAHAGIAQPTMQPGAAAGVGRVAVVDRPRAARRAAPVVTLLLDEPTAHLDAAAERLVLRRLREFAEQGCAVLVVAHRPALLAAADRVVEARPPSDVFGAARPALTVAPAGNGTVEPTRDGVVSSAGEPTPKDVVAEPVASAGLDAEAGSGEAVGKRVAGRQWLRRPGTAVALGAAANLAGILLTGAAAWLLVRAASLPPVLSLSTAVVLVRGSAVARPLLRYLERLVAHDVAFARLGRRRALVYAALVPRVPGPRLHRRGDLLTRLVDDVDAQVDGLLRGRLPALGAAVTLAVAGLAAGWAAPGLAAWLAGGTLIAAVLAPWLAARHADRWDAATRTARAALRDAVVETVDGIEEVAADPSRAGVPERRSRTLAELQARAARAAGLAAALAHLGWGLAAAGTAAALAGLSAEWSAVLLLGVVALGETVVALPDAALARREAAGADRRIASLTAEPAPLAVSCTDCPAPAHEPDADCAASPAKPDTDRPVSPAQPNTDQPVSPAQPNTDQPVSPAQPNTDQPVRPDTDHAVPALEPDGDRTVRTERSDVGRSGTDRSTAQRGAVRVQGLVAGWDPARPAALTGLDLDLPAGSRTAIMGRSGCGKSTLAAVLGGLLAPRAGDVRLAGRAILVGDETSHVFASTVRENLRLAAPAATDAELVAALQRVGLGDWLAGLPDGLDAWLGAGGSTVSGGQGRRLATARALLADPDLLILDEPTEGIDASGANALMADLLDAAAGRTVLVFAHRTDGLALVDRVLELADGRLRGVR